MKFLYLYPDVHLWFDSRHLLLFDTRSQIHIKVALNRLNKRIAEQLTDVRNLYCIEINSDNNDSELISEINNKNFGKVFYCGLEDRPIAIPPFHILKQSFGRTEDNYLIRVLDLIRTVTLHVGGECGAKCPFCSKIYKQMAFCTNEEHVFSNASLQILNNKINGLYNLTRLNIILSSPDINVIKCSMRLVRAGVLNCFIVSWKNVSELIVKQITSLEYPVLLKILIIVSEITDYQMEHITRIQRSYAEKIVLVYCVSSKSDFIQLRSKRPNLEQDNCEIRYIYTRGQKGHINQHYLLNASDLQSLTANHNCIFRNRELNSELFGEIVIHTDRTVRLNENTEIIGTVEDNWTDMLNRALNKPNPWLLTRNKIEPCSNCIYRDLCPPIRNLELYMGDKLACVDYYKSLVKPEKDNN